MTNDEAIAGAKEFLLHEYQSLYHLHKEAKAVGETRLNFFVTFVAAVSTAAITTQSFISPELRPWLLGGMAVILMMIGLITYRKMLQRRVAIIIYRRRLSRIRAWFVTYYPPVIFGLPYATDQNIRMDWPGKNRLGSTAFSVAFINTALITLSVLGMGLIAFGLDAAAWAIPSAIISGISSWIIHIAWKNSWMKNAERHDDEEMEKLERMEAAKRSSRTIKEKRD